MANKHPILLQPNSNRAQHLLDTLPRTQAEIDALIPMLKKEAAESAAQMA